MKNPFIPVDVDNPTCYQSLQINLEGEGEKQREEVYEKFWDPGPDGSPSTENLENYFRLFCDDVKKQRKRIGGDWAICDARLGSEKMRNYVRCELFLVIWKVNIKAHAGVS